MGKGEPVGVVIALTAAVLVTLGALGSYAARTNEAPFPPNLVQIGDAEYYTESVTVLSSLGPPPGACPAQSPPPNLTPDLFRGVSFTLWWTAQCEMDGPVLNVSIEETNGATFQTLLPPFSGLGGSSGYATWFSPDRICGVEWNRASNATLLVQV
jgi:hypothetical protein